MDQEKLDRLWYGFVAGPDNDLLERLVRPRSAQDFLRKMQADPLLDHTRLMRVAINRRDRTGRETLIPSGFDREFDEYTERLSEIDRMIVDGVAKGFVLTNVPEAMCIRTDGGTVVVISEVLRYALFFMNLGFAHLFGEEGVPPDVRSAALLIAARTMNLNESLDFDLDPRGVIPTHIEKTVSSITRMQIQFIIAHELSHYRLGHVFGDVTTRRAIRGSFGDASPPRTYEVYRRDWNEEFEADHAAIRDLEHPGDQIQMASGAMAFFFQLECLERVMSSLIDGFTSVDTHPSTQERLRRIVADFGKIVGVDEVWTDRALAHAHAVADDILTHGTQHPSVFSSYGSLYLGQWRGRELVDRVDY